MYYFIVNKVSGNGKGYKTWKKIEKILEKKQVNYEVFFSERPKHATEIARNLVQDKRTKIVVAVGGDGTIHDVANGLAGSAVPLGCIPAGSGNDFARGLQISIDYEEALEKILTGEQRKIDIATIGGQCCMTVVGIGFDGQVAKTTNESMYKKWLNWLGLGSLTYVFSLVEVMRCYKPVTIMLHIDGKKQEFTNVWLIAVANCPYYGGGMKICPDARCDDGLLDLCIVHDISKWELLRVFPRVYKGKHILHPSVTMLKGKHVEVLPESPLLIHGDGEVIGETPITVSVEQNFLHIV